MASPLEEIRKFRLYREGKFLDNYTLGSELGKGEFAIVYKCTPKAGGNPLAVKEIKKEKLHTECDVLVKELRIHGSLEEHPHIVNLKAFYLDGGLHIVMELISGGDVFQRIVKMSKYSERNASQAIKQIALALQHCHKYGVVHRDLKPENLLLESDADDAPIKVADFGLAGQLDLSNPNARLYDPCGSPGYVAPELLDSIFETEEGYGREVDIWAVGVLLYCLLSGTAPFPLDIEGLPICREGRYSYGPEFRNVSAQAKDLIQQLLIRDPKARLSLAGLLEHPFIQKYEELPDNHLDVTIEQMKKFNARRRFKKAINAAVALQKFADNFKAQKSAAKK